MGVRPITVDYCGGPRVWELAEVSPQTSRSRIYRQLLRSISEKEGRTGRTCNITKITIVFEEIIVNKRQ